VRSDLAVAVNRALAENGITIPFPQRDLHLRNLDQVREALERK
jgi:small-conductance mechanosensitive channel